MEMYKQASKQKLRIMTTKGPLSVEQLWALSLTDLDALAVQLDDYKEEGTKTFLKTKSTEDKTAKLMFDIVVDILNTKQEENEAARTAKETKEHNQKILALMAEKKDDVLKGMTLEQLEAQLK